MQPFLVALQFLTRLPVKIPQHVHARDQGRSLVYYPLVGLLIGALLALFNTILILVHAPAPLRASLVLVLWVAITGALHLDGLADSADAWLGGFGDRRRTLAIMKDPHSGPVANVAISLVLLAKFAALQALMRDYSVGLVESVVLARTAIIALFLTTPYVRQVGLGSGLAKMARRRRCLLSAISVVIAVFVIGGWQGAISILAASLCVWALRALMLKRIGGMSGDTIGATVELVEALVLVIAALYTP